MTEEIGKKRTILSLVAGLTTGIGVMAALKGDRNKLMFWKYFRKQVKVVDEPKLAIIVRDDLPMTYGKQLSQISHAGLSCYLKMAEKDSNILKRWDSLNRPTVVAKTIMMGAIKFNDIEKLARRYDVLVEKVQDAGRTQIPFGSVTALGIGPADSQLINKICGDQAAFK